MGIQKIGHRNSSSCGASCSFGIGDKKLEDDPVLGRETGNDSDDLGPIEFDYEFCMVDGNTCSIPYDLYDLPNLRGILSLETWNTCLTEEERFHLSVYLPDMDQETFYLTMKEIFGGSNIFFGNPLNAFFKRLKGGLYPPNITCFRDVLQIMQKKMYYHSLRAYHDRMVKMFENMNGVRSQCEVTLGVEQRISTLRKKGYKGGNDLLDLNSYPDDHQCLLNEMVNLDLEVLKLEDKRAREIVLSLPVKRVNLISTKGKGKRVLNLPRGGPSPSLCSDNARTNIVENCSVPKGLLKVVPKLPSFPVEPSQAVASRTEPMFPIKAKGAHDCRFLSLPASLYFRDSDGLFKLPFLWQQVHNDNHSNMDQPECLLNRQQTSIGSCSYLDSSIRIAAGEIVSSSDKTGVPGKHRLFDGNVEDDPIKANVPLVVNQMVSRGFTYAGEGMLPHLSKEAKEFLQSSLQSDLQYIRLQGEMEEMTPIVSQHVSDYPRTPCVGNNCKEQSKPISFVQSNHKNSLASRYNRRYVSSEQSNDKNTFLLTYKRRKALPKLNSLDTDNPLTTALSPSTSNQKHK